MLFTIETHRKNLGFGLLGGPWHLQVFWDDRWSLQAEKINLYIWGLLLRWIFSHQKGLWEDTSWPQKRSHTIHGTNVYWPTWMVDFYGFHVGQYTIDGDSMGLIKYIKFDQATASFGTHVSCSFRGYGYGSHIFRAWNLKPFIFHGFWGPKLFIIPWLL